VTVERPVRSNVPDIDFFDRPTPHVSLPDDVQPTFRLGPVVGYARVTMSAEPMVKAQRERLALQVGVILAAGALGMLAVWLLAHRIGSSLGAAEGALRSMLKGGVALANKDIEAIMQLLIDAEMKMFNGLKTPVIFMQNVITDLLLGLKMNECFRIFHDHVRNRYKAEPGFITMNVPRLLDVLDGLGIDNPVVCANINKIGFRMCGGIELYEKTIATRRFRPVAMSVLASGAIPPRDAIEYVCRQSKIESIVFGASSRGNIRQTKALIDELSMTAG